MKRFLVLEEHCENTELTTELKIEIANGQLNVQQDIGETDQQFEVIDEANATSQALGSIADCVGDTLPNGGLTAPVAQALTVAVEHFVSRVGSRKKLIPALESFKPQSRLHSTRIALEGIKEFINSMWEAVIKAFRTVYDWIKRAFTSLVGFRDSLKKKVKVIKEKAAALKKEYTDNELYQATKDFVAKSAESAYGRYIDGDADEAIQKPNKAQHAKALNDHREKIIKSFVDDKTLVSYFRKSKTECYTSNEINARFLDAADALSPFLTNSQGNALPYVCKALAEKTAELSAWNGDPVSMKFSEINNYFANVLTKTMCQGETLQLKGGEASGYADTAVYDVVRVNMAFDEDLVLTILRNPIKASVETILAQSGVFVSRPALENPDALLELSSPNTDASVTAAAAEMLNNNLKSHIENTTSALEDLLSQGEKARKKIETFTDSVEREASLKRLHSMLMLASSSTVRILAICQKAEVYESKMITTMMNYSHKSLVVLEAICKANKKI